MSQPDKHIAEQKAALAAELEKEQRISRRQAILKELWKLDQRRSESAKAPALSNHAG